MDDGALLLTWTCYGTWLPGDPRGTVDDAHRTYGGPVAPPNDRRRRRAAARMVDAPFRLDADARRVVHDAIVALADRRGWSLHALNVRTNHVHVLAACYPATGDQALVACKAAATAALRQAGLVGPERRIWTTGGSRRYVRDWEGLERAIVYVRDMQGEGI